MCCSIGHQRDPLLALLLHEEPFIHYCIHSMQVEAGAPLLVLEAMKMEHPVIAPRAGVIKGLTVSVGGQVADGQLLMWMEEWREGGATGGG